MYGYPVRLPPFTNREDFLLPVSIFDDDTDHAINLAGITGQGTFNNWTVTAGAVLTASVTAITIPTYPIGSELSALALTVGVGLGINAGDPITIASGQNSMTGYVVSYTPATGALVAQIGVTFQFEIRRGKPHRAGSYGELWYDFDAAYDRAPVLTAALGNGIRITDLGYAEIRIPVAQFRKLHLATYMAALTMFDGADTRQVYVAELPVQFGGVT